MKQNQLTNLGRVSYFCRHLNSAMSVSLLSFLIIIMSILCIVYQQVGSFYKIKKARIAHFPPFYISSKDQPPTRIFYAIYYRFIQRMAVCQPGNNSYFSFCYILTIVDNGRLHVAIAPNNLLLLSDCMKCAMRR